MLVSRVQKAAAV